MNEKEMVNHPEHYQGKRFEAIDIIEDYDLDFCLGNAIKYILRAGKKGDKIEDIQKAIWYLNREIKMENNPREAATTNITLPKERSQALKNIINAMNKSICPVCGKKLENENMQVCKECEKKIPWGSSISAYSNSKKNHYKSFFEFYKNIENEIKENEINEVVLRCPICGKFKENKEDEVCFECNNKYHLNKYKWHIYAFEKPKDGEYYCQFKIIDLLTGKAEVKKGWLNFKDGEHLSKANIEVTLWYDGDKPTNN